MTDTINMEAIQLVTETSSSESKPVCSKPQKGSSGKDWHLSPLCDEPSSYLVDFSEERSRITSDKSDDNNEDDEEPGEEDASDNASTIGLWDGVPTSSWAEPEHTTVEVKRRCRPDRAQMFSWNVDTIFDWRSQCESFNLPLWDGSSENIQLELRPMEDNCDDPANDELLEELRERKKLIEMESPGCSFGHLIRSREMKNFV